MTEAASADSTADLVIVSPVYNDWSAVQLLLPRIDEELSRHGLRARVLLVNDGSLDPVPAGVADVALDAISELRILSLKRNLGHQRALAIGLAFVHARMPCAAAVVMDADGEDNPADIPRLVAELRRRGGHEVVFAQRVRRSEGLIFAVLYRLYRLAHRVLTGIPVQVGNFSVVPFASLERLVVVSDLWNHYAAAVFQARIRYAMILTRRARRLSGQSSMSLVSLVGHGLSAIAVFADRVGVRILIAAIATLSLIFATILMIGVHWLWTRQSPSPLLIVTVGVGLLVAIQAATGASLFVLQVLFSRAAFSFIPARDFPFFIQSDERIDRRRRDGL